MIPKRPDDTVDDAIEDLNRTVRSLTKSNSKIHTEVMIQSFSM